MLPQEDKEGWTLASNDFLLLCGGVTNGFFDLEVLVYRLQRPVLFQQINDFEFVLLATVNIEDGVL